MVVYFSLFTYTLILLVSIGIEMFSKDVSKGNKSLNIQISMQNTK